MLLSQLHPNEGQIKGVPSNPRIITEEDFAALKKSLRNFRKMLTLRPMVVDEDFNILGGNMRYQALCRLRDEHAKVGAFQFTDEIPDEWVHQDCTLTEKEKREFVIKDNQERGTNDWDKLANEWSVEELKEWDVKAANWDASDSADELQSVKKDDFDEDKDEVQTICQSGDIWQLGNHRLMCGDSTSADDVAKLMCGEKADITFSSPPYNAGFGKNLTKDKGRKKYTNGEDDNKTRIQYTNFLNAYIGNANRYADFNFCNIQMLANNKLSMFDMIKTNITILADIEIWDKVHSQPAAAENVLNSEFEFVFVFSKKANRNIGTIKFHGTLKNIIHIPPTHNEYSKEHNAVFPIELPAYHISNFAKSSVLDLFGGTGTTLIAAEQLNRKCYMMEIYPHYCDVIIARWEKFTGQKAVKL
jgi:DNA modification methylase